MTAQKRFDDILPIAEKLQNAAILKVVMELKDSAEKGLQLNDCVRFVDAISKVKSWGWTAPQEIKRALGFAQAHLAWDNGDLGKSMDCLKWADAQDLVTEDQTSFMNVVLNEYLSKVEEKQLPLHEAGAELVSKFKPALASMANVLSALIEPVLCVVDPTRCTPQLHDQARAF